MKIQKEARESKLLELEVYRALLSDDEITSYIDTLFGNLKHIETVTTSIKDRLLNEYIKTVVADEMIRRDLLERGKIIKVLITTNVSTVDMMITLHDKIDEVFY